MDANLLKPYEWSAINGLPEEYLFGRETKQFLAIPRLVYWYYLNKNGVSKNSIARQFDRSRIAVSLGIRRIQNLIDTEDEKIKPYMQLIDI